MKKSLRLATIFLAALLLILPMLSTAEETLSQPEATVTQSPYDVLATVNGAPLYRKDMDEVYENLLYYYENNGYDVSTMESAEVLTQMALEYAVTDLLTAEKIKTYGLSLTDSEMKQVRQESDAEWETLVADCIRYYGDLPENPTADEALAARTAALAMLEGMGHTAQSWLAASVSTAEYDKLVDHVCADMTVTEEEIQAAYDQRVAADQEMYGNDVLGYEYATAYLGTPVFYMPQGYRAVTRILLEPDADLMEDWQSLSVSLEDDQEEATIPDGVDFVEATPTELTTLTDIDAAKAAVIASVQPQLDEIAVMVGEGTPFTELVAEIGLDPYLKVEPTKTQGYYVHMDSIRYTTEFVQAAFSLSKPGDISAPVMDEDGVYLMMYLGDVPTGPVTMTAEIHDELATTLTDGKRADFLDAQMTQWQAEADIIYSNEARSILGLDLEENPQPLEVAETELPQPVVEPDATATLPPQGTETPAMPQVTLPPAAEPVAQQTSNPWPALLGAAAVVLLGTVAAVCYGKKKK